MAGLACCGIAPPRFPRLEEVVDGATLHVHVSNVVGGCTKPEMAESRAKDISDLVDALLVISDARTYVAGMEYVESLGDWVATRQHVGGSMGQHGPARPALNAAVAIHGGGCPQPAVAGPINLRPEALGHRANNAAIAGALVTTEQRPATLDVGRLTRESGSAFLTDPSDRHIPSHSEKV